MRFSIVSVLGLVVCSVSLAGMFSDWKEVPIEAQQDISVEKPLGALNPEMIVEIDGLMREYPYLEFARPEEIEGFEGIILYEASGYGVCDGHVPAHICKFVERLRRENFYAFLFQ